MVTFKNLVVGITGQLVFLIYKTLVKWEYYSMILLTDVFMVLFVKAFKDVMEAFCLCVVGAEQVILISVAVVVTKIVKQQVKLFIERRLRLYMELERFIGLEKRFGA